MDTKSKLAHKIKNANNEGGTTELRKKGFSRASAAFGLWDRENETDDGNANRVKRSFVSMTKHAWQTRRIGTECTG